MSTRTQTSIVNDALTRIGSTRKLIDIGDPGQLAEDARAMWSSTVDDAIASHPWNFAIRRARLNRAAEIPAPGYSASFTLPHDCLRWLPPVPEDADYFTGIEEGGLIHANARAPLAVRYISGALIEDVSRWPGAFARAMTFAMAEALAIPVTENLSIRDRMADAAEDAMRRARRADAMSSPAHAREEVTVRSTWLLARDRRYLPRGR